jgi:hypothetical protein
MGTNDDDCAVGGSAADDRFADDWAPLPPERLGERPGDVVEVARRPARTAADEAAAEQALAELQRRIAAAGPARSLVAAAARRRERGARCQAQAARVREDLQAMVVTGSPPAPRFEIDAERSDLDPRELEPWFRELPSGEQQRLHDVWAQARVAAAGTGRASRRAGRDRAIAAVVGFALIAWLGASRPRWVFVLAALLGGSWLAVSRPSRSLDAVRMMLTLAAAFGAAALLGVSCLVVWLDVVLAIVVGALVGFDGEARRSGGFDAEHVLPPPNPRDLREPKS